MSDGCRPLAPGVHALVHEEVRGPVAAEVDDDFLEDDAGVTGADGQLMIGRGLQIPSNGGLQIPSNGRLTIDH